MKEIFNENPDFKISHEHELDEEEFRDQIEKYASKNLGQPIPGHEAVTMIHNQEKLQNDFVFLKPEGAKKLIERANAILEEMGYERDGNNWVKKSS